MEHLLKLLDCSQEEILSVLELADQLKYERKHHIPHPLLAGIHRPDFSEIVHADAGFL